MKFNFDRLTDRRETNSLKWNVSDGELPMWVADMDFETAPAVKRAIEERASHGIFGYSDIPDKWYNAVGNWWKRRHNFKLEKSWLVFCSGVVPAISSIVRKLTSPAEKVLIQTPVYNIFFNCIVNNGRNIIENTLTYSGGQYEIDFDDFEQKIRDNHVKLFLLCSPHNPVGRVWKKWELEKIGEICIRYGVIVVSDEIHSDFTWGENKHLMFASLSDDFANISITCTAPSKTFNLAGLQVSNIFIPNETLRFKFKKAVDAAGYSQVNVMGLEACQAAYEYGEEWLTQLKEYLKDNIAFVREFIQTRLPKLTMIEPEGTYLLWIDFRALGLTEAQRQDLIENKANLWLDSGAMFGPDGEGFERFNVACPRSVLKQAFEQLEAAVNSL